MSFSSFTEAVNAAKAGNQEAFSWLYEKTSKEKYYIAIKYMKNQTDAADVLQDAYMKAWQRIGSLAEPEKFPGWVGQIVANTALDALRKKKPLTFSDMSGENDEGEEFVYDIVDEAIDRQPELNYTNKERSEIIRSMIDSLSDEQRMCVMMFYIEEMSVKEIAETLGVSENTVKSRLNYGRKNIKAEAEELKKKGYNFYSIAPLPLLLLLLRGEKASAMGVSTAGATASTAGVATSAAGIAPSSMSANTSTVSGATTTEASSVSGAAASAGANVTKGFFGTVAGKVAVGAAIVAATAGLGFAGYEIVQSMNASSDQVVEAPQAVSSSAAEQTKATPQAETWETLYVKKLQEIKSDKKNYDCQYSYVYLDNDEIPEMIAYYTVDISENIEESDPDIQHIYDTETLRFFTIRQNAVEEYTPYHGEIAYWDMVDGNYIEWEKRDSLELTGVVTGESRILGHWSGHTTGLGEFDFELEFNQPELAFKANQLDSVSDSDSETDPIEFREDFPEVPSDNAPADEQAIEWENTGKMPGGYNAGNSIIWKCKGSDHDGNYYVKEYKLIYRDESGRKKSLKKIPCYNNPGYDKPYVELLGCIDNYIYINTTASADGTGDGNGCRLYAYDIDTGEFKKISDNKCDAWGIIGDKEDEKYMVIAKTEYTPTDVSYDECYIYQINGMQMKRLVRLGNILSVGYYKGRLYYGDYGNNGMDKITVYSCNPDGSDRKKLFSRRYRGENEYGQIYADFYDIEKNNGVITVNDGSGKDYKYKVE